jgi:hypothetical protein
LRVARPGAIIAVWGYSLVDGEDEKINKHIASYYRDVMGPYWDKERKYIDEQFTTVPFPYEELPPAKFTIAARWTKKDLEGYFNTWSSLQHYIRANGKSPLPGFFENLDKVWPDNNARMFYFPVFLRIGRIHKPPLKTAN